MKSPRFLIVTLALGAVVSCQAAFTPGSLAVLRLGDGSQAIANTGNTLYIDELATNGTRLNIIPIPDDTSTALVLSGKASSEGGLTRSSDKSSLVFTAYNVNRTAATNALSNYKATDIPRGIAVIDVLGGFSLAQSATNLFSATNPRCVVTDDGLTDFWLGGGDYGLVYLTPPATGPVTVENTLTSARYLSIVNSNLYFTTQSTLPGLHTLSSSASAYSPVGLIKSAASTYAVFLTGTNSQPSGFALNSALTIAYVADQRTSTGGGVQKWTNNGSGWGLAYTLSTGSSRGAFSVIADFSNATPVLYATTTESTASNRLVRIVDTGSAAAAATIAQSGYQQSFRGVDFAPDARPVILSQPANVTALSGGDATFSVTATSAFALSYQWQKGTTSIGGATNDTLTLQGVTAASAGSYRVIVSNPYASTTSSNATLTVNTTTGKPSITTAPRSQTNTVGGSVTFTVTAGGTAPLHYQWKFNGSAITGETNASLTLNNLAKSEQGSYTVLVTNSLGSVESAAATLTIISVAPGISVQPSSQTTESGSTVIFTVVATGTEPLAYQWSFGGVVIQDDSHFSGTTTATLTLTGARFSDAGSYTVKITNEAGATNSLAAVLTILPAPSAVTYATNGWVYTQDFNGLPNPGASSVNSDNPVTISSVTYSLGDPFDFAFPVAITGNGGLGLSNTLAGWYGWAETASKFGANTGNQTTGGVLSFGATNNVTTNRALGLLATSSTGATAFGVKFINGSSQTLTQMNLAFTGQLWRQQTAAKTILVGYYIDNTGTNAFTTNSTALASLNTSFAVGTAAAYGTNGPLATSAKSLSGQAISWAPGAALWIVWRMPSATGSSQGLGIDDFSFSATGPSAPTPVTLKIQRSGLQIVLSWPASGSSTLQSASELSNATTWTNTGLAPTTANGVNTVTITQGTKPQFYRLK